MYAACAFGASNQPAQFLVNALSTEIAVCSVSNNVFTRGSNGSVLLNGQPASTTPVTFSGNCAYPMSAAGAGVTCQLSYNPTSCNITAEATTIPSAMTSGTQLFTPNAASLRTYLSNIGSNASADDSVLSRQFGSMMAASQSKNLLNAARPIPAPAPTNPAYAPAADLTPALSIQKMTTFSIPSVYSALGPFTVSPLLFVSSSNAAAVLSNMGSNAGSNVGSNVSSNAGSNAGSNVAGSNLTALLVKAGVAAAAPAEKNDSFWPPPTWVIVLVVLAVVFGILYAVFAANQPKPTTALGLDMPQMYAPAKPI